jgi:hypothetical protein
MNPNATPFQPAANNEVQRSRASTRRLAMTAPLAPILMLTDAQQQSMQIQPHIFKDDLILPDLQAASTAISAAEFVLE